MQDIRIIVGAYILNPEGKLLLVTSEKVGNQYVIPGGKIETGETLEAAVIRETREEVGLDIQVVQFLGYAEPIFDEKFVPTRHCLLMDYLCRAESSEVVRSREAENFVWVGSLEEALSYPVSAYLQIGLHRFASQVFA